MVDSPQLIGLLGQLRRAGSKLHKLKLAALAWRTLRGLSHDDQVAVATELGMEGAEKLIEQLGRMGGLSPSAVLSAVKKAEQSDPDQLRSLLVSLTDGEGRREALSTARGAVERWLEEAEAPEQEDVEREGEEETKETEAPVPPVPAPELEPPAHPAAPSEPPPAPIEAPPAKKISQPQVPQATPAPLVLQQQKPVPSTTPSVPPAAKPQTLPATPHRRLILRLAGLRSSIARLRLLSAAEAYTRPMKIGELCEVIESFPPGWARRRALVTLLEAGIPHELPAAIELVDAVADRQTWLWALTALAARDLNSADGSLLIAAAGRSPSLERRVRFRLGAGVRSRRPVSVD